MHFDTTSHKSGWIRSFSPKLLIAARTFTFKTGETAPNLTCSAFHAVPNVIDFGIMTPKTNRLSFDIDAVISGDARLTDAQALELYTNASLHDLGQWSS